MHSKLIYATNYHKIILQNIYGMRDCKRFKTQRTRSILTGPLLLRNLTIFLTFTKTEDFKQELGIIKERFIEVELEKNQFEYECRRLSAVNLDNEEKMKILLEDMDKLTRILEEKGEENEKFKISEMELDNRLNMMSVETARLNELLSDKQREIERLETSRRPFPTQEDLEKYRVAFEESDIKLRQKGMEIDHYVKLLNEKSRENQELQHKFNESQLQVNEINIWQERYTALEKKVINILESLPPILDWLDIVTLQKKARKLT
jgi:hypothetical protein